MRVAARWKIAYLGAVGLVVFALPASGPLELAVWGSGELHGLTGVWGPAMVLLLLAAQPTLALAARIPRVGFDRAFFKLTPLIAVLVVSSGLNWPQGSGPFDISGNGPGISVSPGGALLGLVMGCRIVAMVWAVRLVLASGPPGEILKGLEGLGMPRLAALSLEIALAILGSEGKVATLDSPKGTRKRQNGDGWRLVRPLKDCLDLAAQRVAKIAPDLDGHKSEDLVVIAGIATLSQTIRSLRILPGIPFAPGHKSTLLLPLYIVAADRTQMRWGSTVLGSTNGLLALSFGDGQFGPFEFFKFLAPGFAVDTLWPLAKGRGALAYSGLGLVAAAARFSAICSVGLLVQAPPVFWAVLAPVGIFHMAFGMTSGFVTFHLLGSLLASQEQTADR